jgi:starch synthase
VLAIAPAVAEQFGQLAFVAEGERRFEQGFAELAQRWPGRIAGTIGYDETSAHRLLAGADILLAPARFEPCGLIQLYAMRYGTIPIVHPTGGLVDTVVDANAESQMVRRANGFHVQGADPQSLLQAIRRAEGVRREPLAWRRLCETAMRQDFSWDCSAKRYLGLYLAMIGAASDADDEGAARGTVLRF